MPGLLVEMDHLNLSSLLKLLIGSKIFQATMIND